MNLIRCLRTSADSGLVFFQTKQAHSENDPVELNSSFETVVVQPIKRKITMVTDKTSAAKRPAGGSTRPRGK